METMFNYEIFLDPPCGFSPHYEAAGCYCLCQERILLVQRQTFKSQANKWGVPAGKLEKNEDSTKAVIREFQEEVGIILPLSMRSIGTFFIKLPPIEYTFHMFYAFFETPPLVILNEEENQRASWFSFEEAFTLPLVAAGYEALLYCSNYITNNNQYLGEKKIFAK